MMPTLTQLQHNRVSSNSLEPFFSLTIGDVVQRLYTEPDELTSGIVKDGASNYHDQLGHVISAVFLTGWPLKKLPILAPVVFSTDRLLPEQLAELLQRMLIRCSPKNPRSHRIIYRGSLDQKTIHRIQNLVFANIPEDQCWMNAPDPKGNKLTKDEALAWVFLYCLEDLHVFAKEILNKRPREENDGLPDLWTSSVEEINPALFEAFKEEVAYMMYFMAMHPSSNAETKSYRLHLMENCLPMMGLEGNDLEMHQRISTYLSDETLSVFYDTFIEPVSELDARGISLFGKAFSRMTIAELNDIPVRCFLPNKDIPFSLILEGETPIHPEHWTGVVSYDSQRDLYVIQTVLPPTSATVA